MQYKYGKFEIDTETLPQTSLDAMLRRGITHFLGNEVAAKVVTRRASWEKENTKEGEPATAATDEQNTAWKDELQDEAFKALLAGSVGMNLRGPTVDPFESAVNKIAKARVIAILKANKIKPPKADEKVKMGGVEFSLDDLVARQLAKPDVKAEIEAEATAAVAAQKAKADAAKALASVAPANVESPDDLGL